MRYIDADKLIYSLELSIKSWGRDCNSSAPIMMRAYQDAVYRVKDMPTADVVPKSEVEKIFEEIDREIEEALKSNYEARRAYNPNEEFGMWVQGKIDALRGIEGFLEELKKKRKEVKNDRKAD